MWQVFEDEYRIRSYHQGVLGAVLRDARRQWSAAHGGATAPEPSLLFEHELKAGHTLCFDELLVVREPNAMHRKLTLQTRASMSTAGVARGFSTPSVRFAFRSAILSFLRVPPPQPRVPTITHLSRPTGGKDTKLHGKAWQMRCHVAAGTFRALQQRVYKTAGYSLQRAVFERTTYAYQAKVVSETDVFWSAHGAGLVHLPLLPDRAVVIEMFNCGHFSYLYANLALHLGIRYFVMQRIEPWCYSPQSLYGDTRRNLSKTYAYTRAEAEPVLMQAVRYHMWQDPGPELSGRESRCEVAMKVLGLTGALPVGMSLARWNETCVPGLGDSAAAEMVRGLHPGWNRASRASLSAPGKAKGRRARRDAGEPAAGDGSPGQYTRWAGVGRR